MAKPLQMAGMVAIDNLLELSNALSNGTIADPIRVPLPQMTCSQRCRLYCQVTLALSGVEIPEFDSY